METLRNLIGRVESEENPGAWDALEILGDLKNAASRAPRPRHKLERAILQLFAKRPTWAGPGAKAKKIKKVDSTPPGAGEHATSSRGITGAANTFIDTNVASSSTLPAPMVEDVPMSLPSVEGELHHGPTPAEMDSGVGGADDNATELQRGPLGDSAPGNSGNPRDVTAMILAGFNISDNELARQFLTFLNTSASPLNQADEGVWNDFVTERPGVHLFGIPLDNSSEENRQLRHGLLAVLRRLPTPCLVSDVFTVLHTLRQHWDGRRNFIPAGVDSPLVRLTRDEITNGIAVIHHFSNRGFHTQEVVDIAALLNYILEHRL